jgi:hypothetical protein
VGVIPWSPLRGGGWRQSRRGWRDLHGHASMRRETRLGRILGSLCQRTHLACH